MSIAAAKNALAGAVGVYKDGAEFHFLPSSGCLVDFCSDFCPDLRFSLGKFVSGLTIHPESWTVAELDTRQKR